VFVDEEVAVVELVGADVGELELLLARGEPEEVPRVDADIAGGQIPRTFTDVK
jgi:hypothetical protein